MALNNENNAQVAVIPLGSPSADAVLNGMYLPKKAKILGVRLVNQANIAASNSDYVQLELRKGTTVIAEIDTRAAHENGLVANESKALNIVSGQEVQEAGDLNINYNETDTGTAVALTNANLQIHYFPL